MKVLIVGDVFGRPGRRAVETLIPELRQRLSLDAVVVNCENAAGGKGITPKIADGFLRLGIDVLTTGNHVWDQREIEPYLDEESRLLRPANYPGKVPGVGSYRLSLPGGRSLGVVLVEGRVFMKNLTCPFVAAERELNELGNCTAAIVEVHGEASSEKQAMAWYLDGKVAVVFGTHTHCPTADERVSQKGTAAITDLGMTGPYDSVIGMRPEIAIERFLTQRRVKMQVADGNVALCGAVVEIDDKTGKATSIVRLREPLST